MQLKIAYHSCHVLGSADSDAKRPENNLSSNSFLIQM